MTPVDTDLSVRLRAVRLCVFDVDGTLLDERHEVAAVTREAVEAARASGLEVVLASSRSPNAMRSILKALGGSDSGAAPFIASQGAVLGRFPDGADGVLEVIDHRPAPLAASLEVLDLATASGVSVSWHTTDQWLVSAKDLAVLREARITGCTPTVLDRSAVATGAGPDKLMLISDPDDVSALEQVARSVPVGLQAQFSNANYLEVTADGVDKASAVERFCASREIGLDAVLAMGDGLNDLGMLRLAGVSAAPANARPQVLESADIVCESNDRHGVAELLTALVALRDG